MNKRFLISAMLCAAGVVMAWSQAHVWTLRECLDYAAQHNISLLKTKATADEARINVFQQQGAWLPTLSASTTQSVAYRPFQENASSFVSGGTVSSSSNKVNQNGTYGVNSSWTLFDGNQRSLLIKNARLAVEQTELQYSASLNDIKEQIAQLYIQILYTKEALKVNQELLEIDHTLLDRGKEVVAQGQMAKYELLQLEAQVANGEYDIVNTQTLISQYKMQLKQLLRIAGDEDFDVAPLTLTDEQATRLIPATDAVYAQALTLRPEVRKAQIGIEQADLNYKIARAGWLPSVQMTAGIGSNHYTNSGTEWFELMKRNLNGSVGLTLNVPIFDGRKTKSNVQKAEVEKTIAKLDQRDALDNLYNAIESLRLNALNNQQKFKAGIERLRYNQQNYDAIVTKAKIGTMNIVETLNARTSLLNARQDVLQSKYMTIYNMQMLDFYSGKQIEL